MLGVVLWSDASEKKAVIWCEDQGDLAYVNAGDKTLQSSDFFDAGDLVQFDMEVSKSTRLANNPKLLVEKVGPKLPEFLRQHAHCAEQTPRAANVIPFSRKTAAPV